MTITDQFEEPSKAKFIGAENDITFAYVKASEWDFEDLSEACKLAKEEYREYHESENSYYEYDGDVTLYENRAKEVYNNLGEYWHHAHSDVIFGEKFYKLRLRND